MKSKTLPIKRRPAQKGVLHKLSAVTRSRKQRVAAAPAAGEMDFDEGNSKISRALTIIFLIHIVAVGLIFFHKHFLDGRGGKDKSPVASSSSKGASSSALVPAATGFEESLPRLSTGETVYVVKPGDNYTRIADREGVTELALREANNNVEIRPGLILSVPPRRVVAEEPAELVRMRESREPVAPVVPEEQPVDDGLVAAIDVKDAPRATPVATGSGAAPAVAGNTHVVQSGETIWRISKKYGVSQEALVKANNITDPGKVRIGTKLVIPQ